MNRILLKMFLFMFLMILLTACSNVEKIQHIEVFVVEIPSQGFKKVNAISIIEEGKNYMKADTKAIEDFYDMDGNYIKTEITHSTGNKTYVSTEIGGDVRKAELKEPSTILISDEVIKSFKDEDIKSFEIDNLTKDEEEEVKKHILSFMDLL